MFKNTIPHKNRLNGYQRSIRTGIRLPSNSANLSYYYTKKLTPKENVLISDTSKFVIENLNQVYDSDLVMYPNDDNVLELNGVSDLDSELFDITDKFYNNVPLYYRYKLYFKHYDKTGTNIFGEYTGNSIYLIGMNNKPISKTRYPYAVYLKHLTNDMYEVYIYTSFVLKNDNIIRCIYNAVTEKEVNGVIDTEVKPAYEERINPQPYFKDYELLDGDIDSNSKIKINNIIRVEDTRDLVQFSYRISTHDGSHITPTIGVYTVNLSSALPHEKNLFIGNSFIVSELDIDTGLPLTAKDIMESFFPNQDFSNKMFIVLFADDAQTTTNKKYINLSTDPDGNSYIIAETANDCGHIDCPNKYKFDGIEIIPAYGVKKRDHRQIMIKHPQEDGVFENWYPRIQYGRFTKTITEGSVKKEYLYTIPEYEHESYSLLFGKPYIVVTDEVPTIINNNTIKTKFAPLFVLLQDDDITPANLTVLKTNAFGVHSEMTINRWNNEDGVIELDSAIKDNDDIKVYYTYEQQSYCYRGYINEEIGDFINLDLNPLQYHMVKMKTDGKYKDVATYNLFNFAIHIYIKPSAIAIIPDDPNDPKEYIQNYSDTRYSLYHTFEALEDPGNDILLGKIYVRHNATVDSIELVDTRSLGGGLIEELNDKLRQELEPESDYYWDLGYWDGAPYSENAVVMIKLDRKLLTENGGRFKPQEIENIVKRYIAYGVLPIIEYVSTYSKDDSKDFKLTSEYHNKFDYVPMITIGEYNTMETTDVLLESVYKSNIPYGIIKLVADELDFNVLTGSVVEHDRVVDEPDVITIQSERKLERPTMFISIE